MVLLFLYAIQDFVCVLAISDVNSAGRPPFLRVPPPEPAYGTHDAWLQPLP